MGGIGSGRRWNFGAHDTTDDYRSIDVRWLKRRGMLRPGASGSLTWSRRGEVVGSIQIQAEPERVRLKYRHKSGGDEWQDQSYPVYLDTTPCHLGGARQWFLCPARGCGRRVAVLYGGTIFACRHCYQLAYPSQREHFSDRKARRADRIREKLGWEPGILNGTGWGRPKGMHRKTFDRLCREHDTLTNASLASMAQRLGIQI